MVTPLPKERKARSFATHDGSFHSDEVTACALLLVFDLIDSDSITRTRDENLYSTCDFVCDVGGLYDPLSHRFDHHQITYKGPLSSAGMVLEYLHNEKILSDKEFDFMNGTLIRGVDAHDNGKDPQIPGLTSFSHVISNFAPIHYDANPEEYFKAFKEALHFARGHIDRLIRRYRYNQLSKDAVLDAMAKGRDFLVFDHPIPWIDAFFDLEGERHHAQFVIMPSGNEWKLRCIPPRLEERMKTRTPLPEEWAGLSDEALKKVTGIPGALFCHKGRFISVWQTKEDALQAVQKILRKKS